MTTPVIIGDCTLYLGDCREILPTLGKVDAVVTDPPYGIGFKYNTHIDDKESYPDFIWPIIQASEALVNEGGPVFIWQSQKWVPRFHELFPGRNWRIFVAAKNFTQMLPVAMQHGYDPVVCWWKDGAKPWTAGTANRDWNVANTAPLVASPLNLERAHPCPRPIGQVRHVVEQWCVPGGIVLDPFMGSGTTGVACAKLGRKFIGIEIDPKYFDIACKRIEAAYAQLDLFVPAPREKPVQFDLLGAAE